MLFCSLAIEPTQAALFSPRGAVGIVNNDNIYEASGLAVSRRNPGVIWIHNDEGFGGTVFAVATNGAYLGDYRVSGAGSGDFEDIAIGPGPVPELDYVYLGDIGDNFSRRSSVVVYRFPEPAVYLSQSNRPVISFVAGVQAHKSFLVISLFAPLLALAIWKLKGYSSVLITLVLLAVFLIGGTLVFHATLNSTVGVAFRELITRVFLIPALTPLFYYGVVPDALPFRGLMNSFFIHTNSILPSAERHTRAGLRDPRDLRVKVFSDSVAGLQVQ